MIDIEKNKIDYIKNESYEEYKKNQTKTNKLKINNVWVREENIDDIKKYCITHNLSIKEILCHGTRNGAEIKFFKKYFSNSNVLGTEISETATNYNDTVQWDFHEVNQEWVNNFDIVYSNSWDHSYNLNKSIGVWVNQLSGDGILVLEWSDYSHNKAFNKIDCCGCSLEVLTELLSKKGYVETIQTKGVDDEKSYLVITHKNGGKK